MINEILRKEFPVCLERTADLFKCMATAARSDPEGGASSAARSFCVGLDAGQLADLWAACRLASECISDELESRPKEEVERFTRNRLARLRGAQ